MTRIDPIFVVGMNGSGTGALTRGIAQHSMLYSFPGETRIFPHYLAALASFGDLSDDSCFRKLLTDIRTNHALTSRHADRPVPEPDDWRESPRTLAGAMDIAFGYFMRREGCQRWCEKSPMNALHIRELATQFPDAQFIHIIRDGRDAALSFQRRFGYDPMLSLHRWKHTVATARVQGNQLGAGRYMELRYESLTEQPELELKRTLEFLGLEFEPAVLAPRQRTGNTLLAGTFVANSEKWRTELSLGQQAAMERLAGRALGELGYAVTNSAGDADVSALRQWYLHNRDGARAIGRNLGTIFSNPRRGFSRNLKRVLGRVQNAWRQARSNKQPRQ